MGGAGRGRGESNTPFPRKICNQDKTPVYALAGTGIDQIRIVLSLGGESARLCEASRSMSTDRVACRTCGWWVTGGKTATAHLPAFPR